MEEKSAKRSERDIEKESLRAEERESEVIWDGHKMILNLTTYLNLTCEFDPWSLLTPTRD